MEEDSDNVDCSYANNIPSEEKNTEDKIASEQSDRNDVNQKLEINDERCMNDVLCNKTNKMQSNSAEQLKLSRTSSSSLTIGNPANDNVSGLKLTFKRSPTLGKKTKNYYDSLKKNGKMYLSDEDGIGDDMSTSGREEDERNYCSETELDTLWNQSDSIEADQYKMDPEADQMKESINDFSSPKQTNGKSSPLEMNSAKTGEEDIESSIHLDSSTSSSSYFHSSTPTIAQTYQEKSSAFRAPTEAGKPFYNHPAITESLEFIFDRKLIQSNTQNHRHAGNISSSDIKTKMEVNASSNFGRLDNCVPDNQSDICLKEFSPPIDFSRNRQFPSMKMDFDKVEHELHRILQLSNKHLPERGLYDEASQSPDHKSSNLGHKAISSNQHDGYFFSKYKELLPFSHKYLVEQFVDEDMSRADLPSMMAENKVLQTSLEEQTFRRKHCEKQLALLNMKVLELQQTMAVAMSVDKMKDDAMRGIDEMISKSVEQWKRREEEQQMLMDKISTENNSMRGVMKKQQTAILKCESHIEDMTNRLKEEKERNEKEIKELNKQLLQAHDGLSALEEQKSAELISVRRMLEDERSSRSHLEKELQDRMSRIQTTFENEQLKWKTRELKLEEEIKSVRDDCSERLAMEKMRNDKSQNIIEDLNMSVKQSKKQTSLMEDEMHKLKIDKDRLEDAMKSQEGMVLERLSDMQSELALKSRNEIAEVTQKLVEMHKWDMEELMKTHIEEVESVRKDSNEKCNQAMSTLSEALDDMHRLKEENDMLRNFRKDAAVKMQLMLQMHQQETLKLFGVDNLSHRSANVLADHPNETARAIPPDFLNNESNGDQKQPKEELWVRERDEGTNYLEQRPFLTKPKPKTVSSVGIKLGEKSYQPKSKDFEQNRKFKSVKHVSSRPESFSNKSYEGVSPGAIFSRSQKDIPPTRLDRHVKDVPTNDNQKDDEESLHSKDNSERSNVLRHYIKMMLQQSPSTSANVDQPSSAQKENLTFPG